MEPSTPTLRGGLKPLPPDSRDYSLGGVFGVHDIDAVPTGDFAVAEPQFWKDQRDTDFCTGYAVAAASEDQEGVELCPAFQFAAACKLRGSWGEWGCDLRTATLAAVKIGSLAVADRLREVEGLSRDELADWERWHPEEFEAAKKHAKASVFAVDGPYDLFDNVRAALWRHRAERRSVVTGALWRHSWTDAAGGLVPTSYEAGGFGHALKVYGQKVVDGQLCLVAQLSNGPVGDAGRYYFTREVFNREFGPFGAFMFKDLPAATASRYSRFGICVGDGLARKVCRSIIGFLTRA